MGVITNTNIYPDERGVWIVAFNWQESLSFSNLYILSDVKEWCDTTLNAKQNLNLHWGQAEFKTERDAMFFVLKWS